MICNPENSVRTSAIQNDAVTPAKLDEDGNFELEPASAVASLSIDLSVSDPLSGKAIDIDLGSANSQVGISIGDDTGGAGHTGISAVVIGSGATRRAGSFQDTGTGATSDALYAWTTNTSSTSSAITAGQTGVGGTAIFVDVNSNSSYGVDVDVSGDSDTKGINVETGGQVGIRSYTSGGVALELEGATDTDTLLQITSAGTLVLKPTTNQTNAPFIQASMVSVDEPWLEALVDNDSNDGFMEFFATAASSDPGIYFGENGGTWATNGAVQITSSTVGQYFSMDDDATAGILLYTGATFAGKAISLNHQSGSPDEMTGYGIHIELDEEYTGNGYIYCDESGAAEDNTGPMLYFDIDQSSGYIVDVRNQASGGGAMRLRSTAANSIALSVADGRAHFAASDAITIPIGTSATDATDGSLYYHSINDRLYIYNSSIPAWQFSQTFTQSGAQAKGVVDADTLYKELPTADAVTGTGASFTSLQSGARPYVLIAKADGNFACWNLPITPSFGNADSLVAYLTLAQSDASGSDDQSILIGAQTFGDDDAFNVATWTDTTSAVVSFDASTAYTTQEVTIGLNLGGVATTDNILNFKIQREDNRGDDNSDGATCIVRGYLEIYEGVD
jgi:hypothetical protein